MPDIADEPAAAPSETQEPKARIFRKSPLAPMGTEIPEPTSREKLYQIPIIGQWITLSRVTASATWAHDGKVGIRVTVEDGETCPSIIHSFECGDTEQAREIRDQIARDRNAL